LQDDRLVRTLLISNISKKYNELCNMLAAYEIPTKPSIEKVKIATLGL